MSRVIFIVSSKYTKVGWSKERKIYTVNSPSHQSFACRRKRILTLDAILEMSHLVARRQSSQVQVARLEQGLVLGQRVQGLVGQVQSVLYDLARRQGQPLRDTDVGEFGRLQDLEEDDILGSGVLDVVRLCCRDVANIASCGVGQTLLAD